MKCYMLPVYDYHTNTWIVQMKDGTLKTISNKLYERVFRSIRSKIKTPSDGDALVSTSN